MSLKILQCKIQTLNIIFHMLKWFFMFTSHQQTFIEHLLYVPTTISNYMANTGNWTYVSACKGRSVMWGDKAHRRICGWEENGQGIFVTAVNEQAMDLGGQGFLDLGYGRQRECTASVESWAKCRNLRWGVSLIRGQCTQLLTVLVLGSSGMGLQQRYRVWQLYVWGH